MLTFLVAFVLLVVPLPDWLQWARPEWVTLTLIYWCIALPQRVGITIGLLAGLGVDVLEGSLFGQHGLALVVVAFLALILYQRLRVYSLLQQSAVVFVLVGISQLLCQWVQNVDWCQRPPEAVSSARTDQRSGLAVCPAYFAWLAASIRAGLRCQLVR